MFGRKPSFQSYAFTFAAGLVAGAILGLLYAPVTGKKMQKKVVDVTEDLQDKVRKIVNG